MELKITVQQFICESTYICLTFQYLINKSLIYLELMEEFIQKFFLLNHNLLSLNSNDADFLLNIFIK